MGDFNQQQLDFGSGDLAKILQYQAQRPARLQIFQLQYPDVMQWLQEWHDATGSTPFGPLEQALLFLTENPQGATALGNIRSSGYLDFRVKDYLRPEAVAARQANAEANRYFYDALDRGERFHPFGMGPYDWMQLIPPDVGAPPPPFPPPGPPRGKRPPFEGVGGRGRDDLPVQPFNALAGLQNPILTQTPRPLFGADPFNTTGVGAVGSATAPANPAQQAFGGLASAAPWAKLFGANPFGQSIDFMQNPWQKLFGNIFSQGFGRSGFGQQRGR